MKHSSFQAAIVSILLYGCTTWTLTKRMEKKLDGNYTRMLRAILNKSWRQHPTKSKLYGHLPPITKTIKIRRTRHAGHCWRSRDELISDVLLWTPSHGRAKAGRAGRTYIQQPCADTGCSLEDLPEAMDNREVWRERVSNIRADSVTWWWLLYNITTGQKDVISLLELIPFVHVFLTPSSLLLLKTLVCQTVIDKRIFFKINVGRLEEINVLFFHQIRVRRWLGVYCS